MAAESPPPLLADILEEAQADGVRGRFAFRIGPYGETQASIFPERLRGDVLWMQTGRDVPAQDVRVEMDDGRTVTLRGCVPKRIAFAIGETGQPPEVDLAIMSATIDSKGDPVTAEFSLANLWLAGLDRLEFDGLALEFVPAEAGGKSYFELSRGDRGRVTWLVRTELPSGLPLDAVRESVLCLTDVLSHLGDERVEVPCWRAYDATGKEVLFNFDVVRWPRLLKRNLWHTADPAEVLPVVGKGAVRDLFAQYDLHRYAGYIWEARRDDIHIETCLVCALLALEHVTYTWQVASGDKPEEVVEKNLVEKLKHLNSFLKFIDAKYMGDWLRAGIRNPIMHTGIIPTMSAQDMLGASEELIVLAEAILFRLLGCPST